MVLYHGSTVQVDNPQILNDFTGRDFGVGFYTTTIKEQAIRWAIRKSKIENKLGKTTSPILNVYECEELSNMNELNIKQFKGATIEWLDFVVNNRSNTKFKHKYDIVIGNIADDNVGETVAYVIEGVITKEVAIERLKFQIINDQICFSTEKALKFLKFINKENC